MRMRLRILAAAVGLTLASATPSAAAELIYGSYLPPQHFIHSVALPPMFAEIDKATNGAVKWKLVPGGQLFSAQATLASVGNRMADAGFIIPPFFQRELKHVIVVSDMSMFGTDPLAAQAAAEETFFLNCPECLDDYRRQKTVYLGGFGSPAYRLLCKKPIKTLADVKGAKVRVSGAGSRWVQTMGGVPVNIQTGEMVEAIERGQIDCIVGVVAWLQDYGLFDSVKNVLDFPMGTFRGGGFVVLNRDAWNAMSAAEKAATFKSLPGAVTRATVGYIEEDQKVAKLALERKIAFSPGGQDFAEAMATHVKSERQDLAERARKRGVENPDRIIDTHLRLLAKWEKIVAELKGDHKAYEKALWDEVYSKLDPSKF